MNKREYYYPVIGYVLLLVVVLKPEVVELVEDSLVEDEVESPVVVIRPGRLEIFVPSSVVESSSDDSYSE